MDTAAAQSSAPANFASRRLRFWICLGLVAITWAIFAQTFRFGFVHFDDPGYVFENPEIAAGLTAHGLTNAFLHTHSRNWHPLTTISHMLDCELYGLDARGHHLTNVLLHTLAVVLLFLVLRPMTGAIWRSAFVAAVFAVHPLRAESVAWISERKDVLSAVFFMLTLAAHARYVHRRSIANYSLVALALAFGLMSKPMLVTVPALLLLLDYWPLERFSPPSRGVTTRLVLEKIPLLLLALASAVATILAQKSTVMYAAQIPLPSRIANALVSYTVYVGEMLWPARLAVFYPRSDDHLLSPTVILAAAALVVVTAVAILSRRSAPYFITGWCWYLLMLLPAIGFVQVGLQAHADRYTYLPQIGLGIVIAWGAEAASRRWHQRPMLIAIAATAVLLALTYRGFVQTSYWPNDEALWSHAAAVTRDNDVAHHNFAAILRQRGQLDGAIAHERMAIAAQHGAGETPTRLSAALLHASLAGMLADKGAPAEAMAEYQTAIELRPDYADAHTNLANLLAQKGDTDGAALHYRAAMSIPPEDAASHLGLGRVLLRSGHPAEGKTHLERAAELAPDAAPVLNSVAWVLATNRSDAIRNGTRAVELAERANRQSGGRDPDTLRVLAAAYAEIGRFGDAAAAAQRGSEAARSRGTAALAAALQHDQELYTAGAPLRED